MRMKIYAIFDTAVGAFNQPFFARSDMEAKRAFISSCTKGPHRDTALDSILFHIGSYNDENGSIQGEEKPYKLFTGTEATTIAERTHET